MGPLVSAAFGFLMSFQFLDFVAFWRKVVVERWLARIARNFE